MNKKRGIIIGVIIVALIVYFSYAFYLRITLREKYESAVMLFNQGEYFEAKDIFETILDYQDSLSYYKASEEEIEKAKTYQSALQNYKNEEYEVALKQFLSLGDYENSEEYAGICAAYLQDTTTSVLYDNACLYIKKGEYEKAIEILKSIISYKDSYTLLEECKVAVYAEADYLQSNRCYREAAYKFDLLNDYMDCDERKNQCIRSMSSTIAAGITYSLGIRQNGDIISTKVANTYHQCDVEDWNDIISIDGLDAYSIGLHDDGTVEKAGELDDTDSVDVTDWSDIVKISAGEHYVAGLTIEGRVLTSGSNYYGEGDTQSWNDIIDMDTGWRLTAGLRSDGKVLLTGYKADDIEKMIDDRWSSLIAICVGGGDTGSSGKKVKGTGHIAGLKSDGTVVAAGDNTYGQCNVETWTDIVAIDAGDWHTVGLKKNGTVVVAGMDKEPKNSDYKDYAWTTDDWTNIVSVAAGTGYTLGLKENGEVVGVGYDTYQQKSIPATEWKDIRVYEEYKRQIYD